MSTGLLEKMQAHFNQFSDLDRKSCFNDCDSMDITSSDRLTADGFETGVPKCKIPLHKNSLFFTKILPHVIETCGTACLLNDEDVMFEAGSIKGFNNAKCNLLKNVISLKTLICFMQSDYLVDHWLCFRYLHFLITDNKTRSRNWLIEELFMGVTWPELEACLQKSMYNRKMAWRVVDAILNAPCYMHLYSDIMLKIKSLIFTDLSQGLNLHQVTRILVRTFKLKGVYVLESVTEKTLAFVYSVPEVHFEDKDQFWGAKQVRYQAQARTMKACLLCCLGWTINTDTIRTELVRYCFFAIDCFSASYMEKSFELELKCIQEFMRANSLLLNFSNFRNQSLVLAKTSQILAEMGEDPHLLINYLAHMEYTDEVMDVLRSQGLYKSVRKAFSKIPIPVREHNVVLEPVSAFKSLMRAVLDGNLDTKWCSDPALVEDIKVLLLGFCLKYNRRDLTTQVQLKFLPPVSEREFILGKRDLASHQHVMSICLADMRQIELPKPPSKKPDNRNKLLLNLR